MAKIKDLLKWKDYIVLKNGMGEQLRNEHGKPYTVWLRIIGDDDIQEAFTLARIASSAIRKDFRNPDSIEYKEKVVSIRDASFDECLQLVVSSRSQNLMAEAMSATERPDAVKIEDIAADPDAATLEEQEKLDAANKKINEEYREALDAYVEAKRSEFEAEWKTKTLEELRNQAEFEASNIVAVSTFFTELEIEKVWRACYDDEPCKIRSFTSREDFVTSAGIIKEQILEAYRLLEMGPDEIKNSRKVDLGE